MKIGIGLPNPVPGVGGPLLVEWARRAEEAGFSSLATIDRVAYPSYESMTVLAAAAGATERAVRFGIGWTAGGAPPAQVIPFAQQLEEAWKSAGREGKPYTVALSYFSLGTGTEDASRKYITDYYAFLGDFGKQLADWVPRSPEALRETVQAVEQGGMDELILAPTVADLEQIDLLAKAVL